MKKKSIEYDEFLNKFTGFSAYQILLCAGAYWVSFTTSTLTQISIFLSATPDHRCYIPAYDESNCTLTENEIRSRIIPYDNKTQKFETCYRYDVNVTSCDDVPLVDAETNKVSCADGYQYDYEVYGKTTISLWNLVCDRSILDAITTALFFFGYFVGSWTYGPLSDWYGRKLPILLFTVFYIIVGVGTAFVRIFEVYVVLRFFCGATLIGAYIAVFTYVNEIAPKQYRNMASFLCAEIAALGHSLLPGFAYWFKNWRYLEFLCGISPILFLLVYYFVDESPRWLLAVDREEEAKKIVTKFVKSNKKSFSDEEWENMIETEREKKLEALKSSERAKRYSHLDLFKQPRMRVITIAVMYNWFTVSLVFYGLALNVGNLAGDPYINSAINGAIELVGTAMILLVPFISKHVLLAVSFLFCGVVCLVSTVFIQLADGDQALETTGVAFALAGKLGISGSFILTYSTTTDMFPTVVRGSGISLGSMSARIGSIFTPFTIEAQKSIPWLTQTIFGCLSIFAFLSAIILPEMRNSESLTLVEEAEEFYKENMTVWNKMTRSKPEHFTKHEGTEHDSNPSLEVRTKL